MSVWKRVGDILKSNKEVPVTKESNPLEDTKIGDIVNVDLEEYIVTGKVVYYDGRNSAHRFGYYLQNGSQFAYLIIEKQHTYECILCNFVVGNLDDSSSVPSSLEYEGIDYHLIFNNDEIQHSEGNTDFQSQGEVSIWWYKADDRYFILQWHLGKFFACQGTRTPSSQIKFLKASKD